MMNSKKYNNCEIQLIDFEVKRISKLLEMKN